MYELFRRNVRALRFGPKPLLAHCYRLVSEVRVRIHGLAMTLINQSIIQYINVHR